MEPSRLLADLVLAVHVAIVVFIVGGLVPIIAGNLFAYTAFGLLVVAVWWVFPPGRQTR